MFWEGKKAGRSLRKSKEQMRREQMADEAWKMNGWRMMYQTGVENGWFTGAERSPYESVFYASFESFVALYSLKIGQIN